MSDTDTDSLSHPRLSDSESERHEKSSIEINVTYQDIKCVSQISQICTIWAIYIIEDFSFHKVCSPIKQSSR